MMIVSIEQRIYFETKVLQWWNWIEFSLLLLIECRQTEIARILIASFVNNRTELPSSRLLNAQRINKSVEGKRERKEKSST